MSEALERLAHRYAALQELDFGGLMRRLTLAALLSLLAVVIGQLSVGEAKTIFFFVLAALFALVMFVRLEWALFLFLLVSPFHQYLQDVMGWSTLESGWKDIAAVSIVGVWLMRKLVFRERIHWPPATLPILMFMALAVLQALRAPYGLPQGLYGLRGLVLYIPIYFVAANLALNKTALQRFFVTLAVLGSAIASYGIFQRFVDSSVLVGLGHRSLAVLPPGYGPAGTISPFGTFGNNVGLGYFLDVITVIAFSLVVSSSRGWMRVLAIGALIASPAGILFALSRQVYLGLLAQIAFLFFLRRRPSLMVLPLIIGATLWLGPPQLTDRLLSMFDPQEKGLAFRLGFQTGSGIPAVSEHPMGIGLGTSWVAARTLEKFTGLSYLAYSLGISAGENFYLALAIQMSVLGTLLYLWILAALFKAGWHTYRRLKDPFLKWLAAGGLAFIVFVVPVGFFNEVLVPYPYALYFWFMMGILASLRRVEAASIESRQGQAVGVGK